MHGCITSSLYTTQVYEGYVDDIRNTDNAWMETVAVNFHDETGWCLNRGVLITVYIS